jgi:hypothetical protein
MPTCEVCAHRRSHAWTPLFLRCRAPEQAELFRDLLASLIAAGWTDSGTGREPTTDETIVFVPWAGSAEFVQAVAVLAETTGAADAAEIREMRYGSVAQRYDIPIDVVRSMGEQIPRLVDDYIVATATATLDDELAALLRDPDDR